ncbi:AbrB family transcriptional regulator [Paenibacillus medicaginis]|uniref:AbrB family transcriptional regulator n=1 Tax=Paenibacillus medicaginis TaxID=1470560 RepID=A0ABV5C5A4_9BACL
MAPGGMDQMGIMAHEVGADLLFVSGYQLFRVLFIYFVVAGALKFGFNGTLAVRREKRRLKPNEASFIKYTVLIIGVSRGALFLLNQRK